MTWDEFFMRHAYLAASKSKDSRTQIGAILVKDNRVIGEGYNGICQGVSDCVQDHPERHERPEKYFWYEHGERNSIFSCARFGISTKDSILYTVGTPCADCGRAIIQAGVSAVVVHKQWEDIERVVRREKWDESCARTRTMFAEAGVNLSSFDCVLGVKAKMDGKVYDV